MNAPVIIVPYDPAWPEQAASEMRLIQAAIGRLGVRLEHVGSTAVPGLAAKPIVDLLAGVMRLDGTGRASVEPLRRLGYEYVPEYEAEIPERRYFRKGPPSGRTHHLHMVEVGGAFWTRHLLFRDYLRAHPDEAQAYAALKHQLAERHRLDRETYTNAKTDFVRRIEALAAGWSAA